MNGGQSVGDEGAKITMERMTAFIKAHVVSSMVVLVSLFLTIILLGAVDLFTFRINSKGHLSGNGNPALIFIFMLVPIYLILLGIIMMVSGITFRDRFREGLHSIGIILILIVLSVIGILVEKLYADMIFDSLGGWPDSPYSAIQGWGLLNQYTNTAFINVITYSLGIFVSIIIGYLGALISHRLRVNNKKPKV